MNPIRNNARRMDTENITPISNGARKMVLVLSALSFFALASTAFAQGQGFVPLAPITGLTDAATLNAAGSKNLADFFNNLYKYAIGLAAALAVIQIIWAGLNIALHQDNVSSITDSKGKIYNAIFGLVLVLSPVLVFSIINPNILNLSLNLPELKRAVPSTTTGGTKTPVVDIATGCSVAGGDYFKTATCPNPKAATDFSCGSLTPQLPGCKVNEPSGKCLDTSYTVYCVGKSMTFMHYFYTKGNLALRVLWPVTSTVIPKDYDSQIAFQDGCTGNGGVFKLTQTTATTARLLSWAWRAMPNGCPDDSGIKIDTAQYSGAVCFTYEMTCNPKK